MGNEIVRRCLEILEDHAVEIDLAELSVLHMAALDRLKFEQARVVEKWPVQRMSRHA